MNILTDNAIRFVKALKESAATEVSREENFDENDNGPIASKIEGEKAKYQTLWNKQQWPAQMAEKVRKNAGDLLFKFPVLTRKNRL